MTDFEHGLPLCLSLTIAGEEFLGIEADVEENSLIVMRILGKFEVVELVTGSVGISSRVNLVFTWVFW